MWPMRSHSRCGQRPQQLHALRVGTLLNGYKAATHGGCMIFHQVGVLSTSSCMCVASSAQRGPVRKRFSRNGSRSFAILMPNAPNGCKKPFVSTPAYFCARIILTPLIIYLFVPTVDDLQGSRL